jgi:hypothetical protein
MLYITVYVCCESEKSTETKATHAKLENKSPKKSIVGPCTHEKRLRILCALRVCGNGAAAGARPAAGLRRTRSLSSLAVQGHDH